MTGVLSTGLVVVGLLALRSVSAVAGGISVDAGLMPAEGRWILRTQMRRMRRSNDPAPMDRKMRTYAFPTVLAYGLRRNLTLMIRQAVMHSEMTMGGTSNSTTGLGDLFFLTKYGAYRLNTPAHTFGVSPTLGMEFPTGSKAFTSDTWDLYTGLYVSYRRGPWSADLNAASTWNGFADRGKHGIDPGDEFSLDLAFARQFSIGEAAQTSIAPVLELSYEKVGQDRRSGHALSDTGESVFYVSPGIMFTTSSLILEALVRVPVWQEQKGKQTERDTAVLLGVRFMF